MPKDRLLADDRLDNTIGSPLAHELYAPTTYPSAQCHTRSRCQGIRDPSRGDRCSVHPYNSDVILAALFGTRIPARYLAVVYLVHCIICGPIHLSTRLGILTCHDSTLLRSLIGEK